MNQGRIWTVVKPSVGLPLLLGSVTVIAVGVHFAVLTHTTWFGSYWEGNKTKRASIEESVSPVALNSKAAPGYSVSVTPVSTDSSKLGTSFVVTIAPEPTSERVAILAEK
jgi:light-harvesting protein B-800-850 alpha chain